MPDRQPVPTDERLETPRAAALFPARACAVSGQILVSNLRSGGAAERSVGGAS